jgi:hypothetical protein
MTSAMTPRPGHEPFDEWSVLAAVGVLDGDEQLRFEEHLAGGCARCRERVREFALVATALPRSLPDVPVPDGLRDRVLACVAAEGRPASASPIPPRRWSGPRVRRRVGGLMGGLMAAGLAGGLAWGIHDARSRLRDERMAVARLQGQLADQRAVAALVSHTDTTVASLTGTGGGHRADGWIVWSPARKQGYLVIHHLPALPPGQQYQLWAVAGRRPAPAGVFDVDAVGHVALVVAAEVDRPELFAVSIEPAGGAAVPGGPIVMRGGSPGPATAR